MSTVVSPLLLPGRAVLRIGGRDASAFLQGLVTCDVHKAAEGLARLGVLLSPQGKFLLDFFLLKQGEDFLMDTEAVRAEELLRKLTLYRLRAAVELALLPAWGVAAALGEERPPQRQDTLCVPDPRHPAMGWRIYGAQAALPASEGEEGAMEAYETRRISLGLPDGSRDAEIDRTLPLENGYDRLGGVDFTKGCYVGQEVTARSKHRGQLRKFLHIVTAAHPLAASGTAVLAGDTEIGTLRSVCGAQGLATVHADRLAQARQQGIGVSIAGQAVDVEAPWWCATAE